MIVFKRGMGELIKSIVIAIVTGFVIVYIGSFFTKSIIMLLVGGAVSLILIYMAFYSENIRFEVDGEQLRYFEKNKLSAIFNINNCNFRYYIKNDSHGADDINLYITKHEDPENEICIDCEPLGEGKFLEMFNLIGNNEIVKMEAVKKEK